MDANTYIMVAALNALRHQQLGASAPEAEFTPFNLSALRDTPKRAGRFKPRPGQTRPQRPVEALTSSPR